MTTQILTLPNPKLRRKSAPADLSQESTSKLIKKMITILRNEEIGVGLSAPQIGENLRIFVIEARAVKDKEGNLLQTPIPLSVFVNPKIIKMSKEKVTEEEGCLSCPNYYGPVERSLKIKVEAFDQNGVIKKVNTSGLFARIIQHEYDHLNGILFLDRVRNPKDIREYKNREDNEL